MGAWLALVAVVPAITLAHLNGALALLLSTVAWFAGAFLGHFGAWFR